jgi:hypothetical protein
MKQCWKAESNTVDDDRDLVKREGREGSTTASSRETLDVIKAINHRLGNLETEVNLRLGNLEKDVSSSKNIRNKTQRRRGDCGR